MNRVVCLRGHTKAGFWVKWHDGGNDPFVLTRLLRFGRFAAHVFLGYFGSAKSLVEHPATAHVHDFEFRILNSDILLRKSFYQKKVNDQLTSYEERGGGLNTQSRADCIKLFIFCDTEVERAKT